MGGIQATNLLHPILPSCHKMSSTMWLSQQSSRLFCGSINACHIWVLGSVASPWSPSFSPGRPVVGSHRRRRHRVPLDEAGAEPVVAGSPAHVRVNSSGLRWRNPLQRLPPDQRRGDLNILNLNTQGVSYEVDANESCHAGSTSSIRTMK